MEKKAVAIEILNDARIPKILATARGKFADKIIDVAKKEKVTLFKDNDLVQCLEQLNPGEYINEEHYKVMAEVVFFCYNANKDLKDKIDDIYFKGNFQ